MPYRWFCPLSVTSNFPKVIIMKDRPVTEQSKSLLVLNRDCALQAVSRTSQDAKIFLGEPLPHIFFLTVSGLYHLLFCLFFFPKFSFFTPPPPPPENPCRRDMPPTSTTSFALFGPLKCSVHCLMGSERVHIHFFGICGWQQCRSVLCLWVSQIKSHWICLLVWDLRI